MPATSLHTAQFQLLLARWRNGDQQALNELFTLVDARLQRLARQMLRGYARVERWTEADDILQNASIRLLRALQETAPPSMRDFYALAALQMRRELLDLVRRFHGPLGLAARHDSRGGENRAPVEPSDASHEPGLLAQWREFHERIEQLGADEREVVGLLYYQGLTQREAAEVLGVNVRTIQRRWHDALVSLAPLLDQFRSTS
ncbi:MAG TPA: sigma-70 family RNA polymerase sigma factor [Pirellulaceae bacterium]|nr:sigma-70 family RNA polymerase sigma factor [Pirellulaceae bacterium]